MRIDVELQRVDRRRVFFFQAEDGIRDIGVTGVQTCALPISDRRLKPTTLRDYRSTIKAHLLPAFGPLPLEDITTEMVEDWRSEERRVGKECRSRWSPYH